MPDSTPSPLSNVVTIDDDRVKSHLDWIVRGNVDEALDALLDAEADRLSNAQRCERSEARRDTQAGHCERKLHTKAGEVRLKQFCQGIQENVVLRQRVAPYAPQLLILRKD